MSIGVVVTLPEPAASRVRALQRALGVVEELSPPHITLLSVDASRPDLCRTAEERWTEVRDHVARAARAVEPFTVALGEARTFAPLSPVAYLSVTEGEAPLAELARLVSSGPLAHTPAFEYVPHVTLVYPGTDEELEHAVSRGREFDESFPVDTIGLYRQLPSGRWEHREEIPLGNSPQTSQRAQAASRPGEGSERQAFPPQ